MDSDVVNAQKRPLPGQPGNPGRPPGAVSKHTKAVRDAILKAFDEVGGHEYLVGIAQTDPAVFCTLLGKLIPTELKADVTVREGFAALLERARERACLPSTPTQN